MITTSISPGRYTQCDETLLVFGTHSKLSFENNIVNSALEHIAEANTLLRGLGFESGRHAASNAIHNGLSAIPETHRYFDSEKVAIGLQAIVPMAEDEKIKKH